MKDPLFWILVFGSISCILGVGLYKSRSVKTEASYLLANRNTGLFALIATLVMTELNTGTLIAFSGMGYAVGWLALSLPAVFLIGLLWYGLSVAHKWKDFNGLSVAHYFTKRYGKDIGLLTSIIFFSAMAIFSAAYVKSLALLLSPLFPLFNLKLLTTFVVLLVLIMALRGGLVAIIWTDIVSFVVVVLFMPALLYYTWAMPQFTNAIPPSLGEMMVILPPSYVFSLILLTMFSYILAPWYGQKIISAKNQKVARMAVIWSALLVFILYGLAVFATSLFKLKGIMLTNSEMALPRLFEYALPLSLQAVGYGVFFCIGATTLSGVWSAMTTLIIHQEQRTSTIRRSVLLTLFCALTSLFLANTLIDKILNKIILANIPIVALSFALLARRHADTQTRRHTDT